MLKHRGETAVLICLVITALLVLSLISTVGETGLSTVTGKAVDKLEVKVPSLPTGKSTLFTGGTKLRSESARTATPAPEFSTIGIGAAGAAAGLGYLYIRKKRK